MHSCALTMAMLCGPKLYAACASVLPAGSWIPLSGDRRAGKPLALLALISGENQTARSKNADVAVTTVRGATRNTRPPRSSSLWPTRRLRPWRCRGWAFRRTRSSCRARRGLLLLLLLWVCE